MKYCTVCECTSKITVRREEKLILGEQILQMLIEDRFVDHFAEAPSSRDETPVEVNFDLSPPPFPVPAGHSVFRDLSSSDLADNNASVTGRLKHLADLTSNKVGLISNNSPTSLGRGSPTP